MARFFASGSLLLVAGAVAVAALPARALELVPGGYGAGATIVDTAALAPGERFEIDRSAGAAGMSIDFTPRHAASALVGGPEQIGPQLEFTVRGGDMALDHLGLVEGESVLHPGSRKRRSSLTVGGAMRWSDWTIGGGIGRAEFMGTDVDLLSASLGYGRLSAEIAFGQSSDYQAQSRDVLMLSTDLAAWSWLTLESDLALGSRATLEHEDESVAVGRFGLRLNF